VAAAAAIRGGAGSARQEADLARKAMLASARSPKTGVSAMGDYGSAPSALDTETDAEALDLAAELALQAVYVRRAVFGVLDTGKIVDVTSALAPHMSGGRLLLPPHTKTSLPGFGDPALFRTKHLMLEYTVGTHAILRTFGDSDGVTLPHPSDVAPLSVDLPLVIVEASYGVLDKITSCINITPALRALLGDARRLTLAVADKLMIPGFSNPAVLQAKQLRVVYRWGAGVFVRVFGDRDVVSFPTEADVRPNFPLDAPVLRVIKAEFGVLDSRHVQDVTNSLRAIMAPGTSRLCLPSESKRFLSGFGDPAFMQSKQLAITYVVGDSTQAFRMRIGEADVCDIPSDEALQIVVPHGADDEPAEPARAMMSAADLKVAVQLGASQLSRPIPVSAIGASGSVPVSDLARAGQVVGAFNVGVTVALGAGKFRRTRVVTVRSHFVLHNRTGRTILVRQKDTPVAFAVEPGRRRPFHWVNAAKPQVVSLKYADGSAQWSGAFDMHILEEFELGMRRPFGPPEFVRVAVNETDASCIVSFNEADALQPPFRIVNHMDQPLGIYQKGVDTVDTIKPGAAAPFSWDEPLRPHVMCVRAGDGAVVEVEIDRVGDFDPLDMGRDRVLRPEVVADGPTRVVHLHMAGAGSVAAQQRSEVDLARPQLLVGVELAGLGVSVVDSRPREILYLSLRRLRADVTLTAADRKIKVEVGDMQIDNQLAGSQFPVLLAMTPKDVQRATLEFCVVQSTEHTSIDFFRYAALLVQELDIRVEADCVMALVSLVRGVWDDVMPLVKMLQREDDESAVRRVYFELLHLHPFIVHLTFASGAALNEDPSVSGMLKTIGFTLANIDNAPLKLNALALEHMFGGRQLVGRKLAAHYTRQAIAEGYKVVGSIDLIGNPVGLFDSLSTGVMDFFYEPARGVVAGPGAFGRGLVKGSLSLVKNSVYGVMNAGSRITGSISKGFAALSFDQDYLNDRERDSREKPADALEGMGMGGVSLVKGIVEGVAGLVVRRAVACVV
jgi:hypothetical protein